MRQLCMEFYSDHSFTLNSQRDTVKNNILGKYNYCSNFTVPNNTCLQILKKKKKRRKSKAKICNVLEIMLICNT